MMEKIYDFTAGDGKIIEKIVDEDPVNINHVVLPEGEGLPVHFSNSNVYMVIVRGTVTLGLDGKEAVKYAAGRIVGIPYNTKMNVSNFDAEVLEFFIVKSPNPRNYKSEVKE